MSSWAKVGAKCVCIDSSSWNPNAFHGYETLPVQGEEYTVRSVDAVGDIVIIRLDEIINPEGEYGIGYCECAFIAARFHPLITQDDDVALFAHHLDTAPVKPVDA